MTAIRKIVDSSSLVGIFELPPVFMNRKVEVIVFPAEDTVEVMPKFTRAQIEEAANSPDIQSLVGALKGKGLPENLSMKDIRQMRLEEKYNI